MPKMGNGIEGFLTLVRNLSQEQHEALTPLGVTSKVRSKWKREGRLPTIEQLMAVAFVAGVKDTSNLVGELVAARLERRINAQ